MAIVTSLTFANFLSLVTNKEQPEIRPKKFELRPESLKTDILPEFGGQPADVKINRQNPQIRMIPEHFFVFIANQLIVLFFRQNQRFNHADG